MYNVSFIYLYCVRYISYMYTHTHTHTHTHTAILYIDETILQLQGFLLRWLILICISILYQLVRFISINTEGTTSCYFTHVKPSKRKVIKYIILILQMSQW